MPRSRWCWFVVWLIGCATHGGSTDAAQAKDDPPTPAVARELPQPDPFPTPRVVSQKLAACEVGDVVDPGPGTLLVERGDQLFAIPLQHTAVDTIVTGTIAETTVTQLFVNPFDEPIEAVYLFPLPHDAAVDDYWFHVGKRHIHGVMKERQQAQAMYEEARREGKAAALLAQERPNVFQQSVANIAPGETILVEMHMAHPLEQRDGAYTYAFPTVVGPHYQTGREAGQHAGQSDAINPPRLPEGLRSGHDIEISVAIETGIPARDVASTSHRIVTEQRDGVTKVRLAEGDTIPNRDFVLTWKLGDDQPRAWLMTQRHPEGGYFMLTVQPPQKLVQSPVPAGVHADVRGRELVFVVDTSGSMEGEPIASVKRAMARVLDGMRENDAFQVLEFSTTVSHFGRGLAPNTEAQRGRAQEYVRRIEARGGTELIGPLEAALALPRDPARMRLVFFMTDGYVSNDREVFGTLERKFGDARLFAFGVGAAPNRHLLDGMALFGRGLATYVRPDEHESATIDRFYERVAEPVLTDIHLDFGGLAAREVVPAKIPDLFAGQPVVVFGKFTGDPKGTVSLRGKLGSTDISIPVDVAADQGQSVGLRSMWARKRIDDLLLSTYRMLPEDPQREAVRREVIEVALAHAVMTEYTAFVAIDEQRVVDPDSKAATVAVPVPLPAGMAANKGGVGTLGTGYGGGGTGEGTIGLGNIGLIGKGGAGHERSSGAGYGGRGSRVPRVRQGAIIVSGSLDEGIIRRNVRMRLNEIRYCYGQGLIRDPRLAGEVEISFGIADSGEVFDSTVKSTTLADPEVVTCMTAAVLRWRFPKVIGGVRVVQTFEFAP